MKKLLKIILFGLAGLTLVGVAAIIFLTSSPGESWIRDWLEGKLTEEVGLPVHIGALETNLWTHVQIDTLRVGPSADSTQPPVLYVGHIYVGYSIPKLLGNDITLSSLTIDSVAVGVRRDSLGQFGIPALDTPSKASSDTAASSGSLCVDTLSLNRLAFNFADQQIPLSVELNGARMTGGDRGECALLGRFTAVNVKAVYDRLALDFSNIEVIASFDGKVVDLNKMVADCEGIHLAADGEMNLADEEKNNLHFSAEGSLGRLAEAVATAFDLPHVSAGQFSADIQYQGAFDNPRVTARAEASDLGYQQMAVRSAKLKAAYNADTVVVDTFELATFDGLMAGSGRGLLDSAGTFAIESGLDRISLVSLWQALYGEQSPYRGTVSGRVKAGGEINDITSWTGEASLSARNLSYHDKAVPDLTCAVVMKSGRTSLALQHGVDTIRVDLALRADSLQAKFDISMPDITALARFADQPDLSGGLWAEGEISGSYDNPSARATMRGSSISYRNLPVDSLRASVTYRDSLLTVGELTFDGHLDSVAGGRAVFGFDSLGGAASYSGRFVGSLDSLTGVINATFQNTRYGSQGVDRLSLQAALDASMISITSLEVARGELGARMTAAYDTSEAAGSFDVSLYHVSSSEEENEATPTDSTVVRRDDFGAIKGEFTLQNYERVTASVQGRGLWLGLYGLVTEDTLVIDGDADFDLSLEGPYLTPEGSLRATARGVDVSGYNIDSLRTRVALAGAVVTLDSLVSYTLGQTLQASGRIALVKSSDGIYELTDSAEVTAQISTDGFDLSMIQSLALPGGELAGRVSASLAIDGTLAEPHVEGWLKAEKGRVLLEGASLPLESIGLSLIFADSVFTIETASAMVSDRPVTAVGTFTTADYRSAAIALNVAVGELGRLVVDGTLSLSQLNVQITSDSLNLAVAQPMITEVDSLAGRLGCRMKISGSTEAPEIEGSLHIAGLSFLMPRHFLHISGGYADARFEAGRLTLDSAGCVLNGGTVTASGIISHDHYKLTDINLSLQALGVALAEPDMYTAAIDSASLSYGKQQENYVLEGDIVLGESRLTVGLRPTSILPWVQSIETVDMEYPDLIARTRLDVRIRESNNLWVDNNLANIRLRAELGVIGTPVRPNFTGLVQIEEGHLLYLDRRFRVDEGTIYFNDPTRFNPDVNLNAVTEVTTYRRTAAENYKVYIKAEGLLDQLQYGLYSEPPLDKPDIVALLTLGATRTELAGGGEGNGESGLTEVLKERAAMLTSERVSGYLSRQAGSLFGFDKFTIQGNLFKFDDSWGPQLVASKSLSKRLDVTYSTNVGHLNDQSVRLGYRLTRRFILQGETDRQGNSGLDLKYGFTFK